jgi:hypothetical protein
VCFGLAVSAQRRLELVQRGGVAQDGLVGDRCRGPAERWVVIDLQTELLGDRLEALVVVAALAAGVPDLMVLRDRVRRFVQQRRQNGSRTAGKAFPADEDLGERVGVGLPAARGEMP